MLGCSCLHSQAANLVVVEVRLSQALVSSFQALTMAASSFAFTSAEVLAFKTIQDVSEFIKLPGPVFAAFCLAADADGGTMPRVFGVLPIADFNELVATLKVETGEGEVKTVRAPSFSEKGKLALFIRACTQCAMLGGNPVSPPVASVAAAPSLAVRKVRLSEILRQGADVELPVAPESLMTAGEGRLKVLYGANYEVPQNVAVTIEQLTSVNYLIESKDIPYLDFALWGPHGHRTARKMRLIGQVFDSSGMLRTVEIAGPPNIDVWLDCFHVMCTAFLMLNIMDLGTLTNYAKLITDFHARYGSVTWLLLYQADTRFRQEHVDRCRRRAATAHETARAATGTTEYEPLRPWNFAYQSGTNDSSGLGSWWYKEYTELAVLILTRTDRLENFLGGDAPVTVTGRAIPEALATANAPKPVKRPMADSVPAPPADPRVTKPNNKKKKAGNKGQARVANGKYVSNKSGTPLCSSFQLGSCEHGGGGRCPRDLNKAHQCEFCLSRDHGANICTAGRPSGNNTSGGKNKGGGKSRGKGKNQW